VENVTERTPIGIPVLDQVLDGGIPRGYVVLLEIDTGTRPDVFITNFLATGLTMDESAYILCTEYPLHFLFQHLRNKGVNVNSALEENQLIGIDAFADAFGWGEFEPESEYSVEDLTNSRQVIDIIRNVVSEIKSEGKFRGVIDSLSSLLHAADDPNDVINFVHHQMSAQKSTGNLLLYTIHSDAHPEELIRRIEHIVDGVIALYKIYDDEGWNIALQIEKMRGIDFEPILYHYHVKDSKITLRPFETLEYEEEEEEEEEEE
jgi:KaiC/GvpD/RAD55 family RecA-like ATPase